MQPEPNKPAETTSESATEAPAPEMVLPNSTGIQITADDASLAANPTPGSQLDSAIRDGALENCPQGDFPGIIQNLALDLHQCYQVPPPLTAMAALGVISGAVGQAVVVRNAYPDRQTHLNQYLLAVVNQGSGPDFVFDALAAPLVQRSQQLAAANLESANHARAMLGLLKKQIQRTEEAVFRAAPDERKQLLTQLCESQTNMRILEAQASCRAALIANEPDGQALARYLADNSGATFNYSSDATAVVKAICSGRGEEDIRLLSAAFNGNSFSLYRYAADLMPPRSRLTLFWCIPPDVARRVLDCREVVERDLWPRFLMFNACCQRVPGQRSHQALTSLTEWNVLINGIVDHRLSNAPVREIICSPEAREVFDSFDDEGIILGQGALADYHWPLACWREHGIKVAGSFALAEQLPEITPAIANRAIRVVRWATFNILGSRLVEQDKCLHRALTKLENALRSNGGKLPVGVLSASKGLKRGLLDQLLSTYPDRVQLERHRQTGPGKPSEVISLVLSNVTPEDDAGLSMTSPTSHLLGQQA